MDGELEDVDLSRGSPVVRIVRQTGLDTIPIEVTARQLASSSLQRVSEAVSQVMVLEAHHKECLDYIQQLETWYKQAQEEIVDLRKRLERADRCILELSSQDSVGRSASGWRGK
jgi:chromosome segregation ATPase